VGFHERKFEVVAWKLGVYSVAAVVRNCHDNFTSRLIIVYGSPFDEGKQDFINELEELLVNWDGPTVVGGG
jgi:hypothetical protein